MRNVLPLAAVFLALSTTALADGTLPAGAIKKGSLANAKLVQDAKLGVAAKVATKGCSQPGGFELRARNARRCGGPAALEGVVDRVRLRQQISGENRFLRRRTRRCQLDYREVASMVSGLLWGLPRAIVVAMHTWVVRRQFVVS